MLDTDQEKRDFWASSEFLYDPMDQPGMHSMWVSCHTPRYEKAFKEWLAKQNQSPYPVSTTTPKR